MQIFNGYKDLPGQAKGAFVVIGNFDGVHRGHQILLAKASRAAQKQGKPLAVLTFEPHPRALFRPDDPPFRITPEALKFSRLQECGVDIVYAIRFDWPFASQSAQDFLRHVLVEGIKAAHVFIGEDFRFGQLRKGTPDDIRASGIPVSIAGPFCHDGGVYSSSEIRTALRHGHIDQARALLGWEWEIAGEVIHGDKRGRELGYPTANVKLDSTLHPAYGVYAARARIEGEEDWLPAATNIGIRPMFKVRTAQVETFIFDFDRDIYGRILHVRPVSRIRGEAKFSSLEELITQMEKDCAQSRRILAGQSETL
jgi:riboflavin kinase/FMN adenylyltransferase